MSTIHTGICIKYNRRRVFKCWEVKWKLLSHVWLFVTPWTVQVHAILQARILEWVTVPLSRGSSQPRDWMQVCISALLVESPGKSKCWETCTVRNLLMFPLQWKTAATSWFSSDLKTQSKLQYHDFWPSKFSQKGNYYAGKITNTARFVNTVKGWLHIYTYFDQKYWRLQTTQFWHETWIFDQLVDWGFWHQPAITASVRTTNGYYSCYHQISWHKD